MIDQKTITSPIKGQSPRQTGGAGNQFEVQVGVHYALAVLARTEAFGLPGYTVTHLAFQRADRGHPLDDVVLTGTSKDVEGVLEIQVKRALSFTASNQTFERIVADIVAAHHIDPNRRFSVAIERTNATIDTGVQEALELSRRTTNADSFETLLAATGRSNQQMRDFVGAFTAHAAKAGLTDKSAVFACLKAFSVMVFDYGRPNSLAEQSDRWRANQLCSAQTPLFDALTRLVGRVNAAGGDFDRASLIEQLRSEGVEVGGAPALAPARARARELSKFALTDIDDTIQGINLPRPDLRTEMDAALYDACEANGGGVVELSGEGGVGKSVLLKAAALAQSRGGPALVLSPDRIPSGGWSALQARLDLNVPAKDFLQDFACDGGGVVFIDGLDRFRSEGERKTISDIILTLTHTQGVALLFTARPGWQRQNLYGDEVLAALLDRRTIVVERLNEMETQVLADALPTLSGVLAKGHPAETLARNPFILKRFASSGGSGELLTEARFAKEWWASGAHHSDGGPGQELARRRILKSVAEALLSGETVARLRPETIDPEALVSLFSDGVLSEVATDKVRFRHDLFSDWAIAAVFREEVELLTKHAASGPPDFWLVRGAELCLRDLAEATDPAVWASTLELLSGEGITQDWVRLVLLSLVRSETGFECLSRHGDSLLQDDGERLALLIRAVIGNHSVDVRPMLEESLPEGMTMPDDVSFPEQRIWLPLVGFVAQRFSVLQAPALAAAVELFEKYLVTTSFAPNPLVEPLIERLVDLLIAHMEDRQFVILPPGQTSPPIRYPVGTDAVDTARLTVALYVRFAPVSAARYLDAIASCDAGDRELSRLLEFPGTLPSAAPSEFAEAFAGTLEREFDEQAAAVHRRRSRDVPYTILDQPFGLGRCGVSFFDEILAGDGSAGVDMVRRVTRLFETYLGAGRSFDLTIADQVRTVSPHYSYAWCRGHGPSRMVSLALAALEHWAHGQVESGRSLDEVIIEIAGEGPISGAFALILVDLIISHGDVISSLVHRFLGCPDLLAMDSERRSHDQLDALPGMASLRFLRGPKADQPIFDNLKSKPSRRYALHDFFPMAAFQVDEGPLDQLRADLAQRIEALGEWTEGTMDWGDPRFMADYGLRALDRANYSPATREVDGKQIEGWVYEFPPTQAAWQAEQARQVEVENSDFTRSLALRTAMNGEDTDLAVAIDDARSVLEKTEGVVPDPEATKLSDPKDPWIARVGAAAFLARHLPPDELRGAWPKLQSLFKRAIDGQPYERMNLRFDVMYDPAALAITGLIYAKGKAPELLSDEFLLAIVMQASSSAAAAFSRHHSAAGALDRDLLTACIRTGLFGAVHTRRKGYDEDDGVADARTATLAAERRTHFASELAFLSGIGPAVDWPTVPSRVARDDNGEPLERGWPDRYFNERTGEVWLRILERHGTLDDLAAVFLAARDWLIAANTQDARGPRDFERVWSRALMTCAAHILKTWSEAQCEERVYLLLDEFTDEAFLSLGTTLLTQSDLIHIEGRADNTAHLAQLRARLWKSLQDRECWRRHGWSHDGRYEHHLYDLVSAFFMKISYGFGNVQAYTGGLTQDQVEPFLETLSELTVSARHCSTTALLFLDVMSLIDQWVAEQALRRVASVWAAHNPVKFWQSGNIGTRVCNTVLQLTDRELDAEAWLPIAEATASAGMPAGSRLRARLKAELLSGD
jgi:hypothetical protein